MANMCEVDIRIAGEKDKVEEFITELPLFDKFYVDERKEKGNLIQVTGCGDVKWSIKSALKSGCYDGFVLKDECKRLNLACEIFSSEPGCQFQEHFLFAKNKVVIDKCVNYEEYYPAELSYERRLELSKEKGIDMSTIQKYADEEECMKFGGFKNYCEFEDLLEKYFS